MLTNLQSKLNNNLYIYIYISTIYNYFVTVRIERVEIFCDFFFVYYYW